MSISTISSHIECLAHLQQKISLLKELNNLWQQVVPENLQEHTQVANYRDGYLIIEIDNANWGTLLRFAIPELTKKLRSFTMMSDLKTIEWYIRLPKTEPMRSEKATPLLSENSAALIKEFAKELNHTQLKNSLEHLATHSIPHSRKT